jgi:hypothetical protein
MIPGYAARRQTAQTMRPLNSLKRAASGVRAFKVSSQHSHLCSLTFEVTCVRQRDALARQGNMSIARTAGQVWHAVARQVHRRVRLRRLVAALAREKLA